MFNHIMVGSNDIERSKRFYDAVLAVLGARGRHTPERHTALELGVLYWHLVDVIWIFVWPLMYLQK